MGVLRCCMFTPVPFDMTDEFHGVVFTDEKPRGAVVGQHMVERHPWLLALCLLEAALERCLKFGPHGAAVWLLMRRDAPVAPFQELFPCMFAGQIKRRCLRVDGAPHGTSC